MKQGNGRSATWIWLMLGYSLALLAVSLPVGSIKENINGLILVIYFEVYISKLSIYHFNNGLCCNGISMFM